MVASESLVLENNDYQVVRDVDPGEAIFINLNVEFFLSNVPKIKYYVTALLNMLFS